MSEQSGTTSGGGAQASVEKETKPTVSDPDLEAESSDQHNIDPENGIHLSICVPDRPTLHETLRSLVEEDIPFDINRISDAGEHSSLAIVDMGEFTNKQREALELAFAYGYYETPREADLETISNELDVSKSAVSQRLRSIESKLVNAILSEQTGTSK